MIKPSGSAAILQWQQTNPQGLYRVSISGSSVGSRHVDNSNLQTTPIHTSIIGKEWWTFLKPR